MTPVPSAKDEPASSSHVENTTSLSCSRSYEQDLEMKTVDFTYIDPQLYEAGLYMNSISGDQGEIPPTSDTKEENYTYMDPLLYKATAEGNFEPFKKIGKELSLIRAPGMNTILHIHIGSQSEASEATAGFAGQVLDKCPSLLFQVNVIGDTPLHVAAKYGHDTAVEFLINHAKIEAQRGQADVKQMLRKTNDAGNTGLHEAVRHEYSRVVKILTKEDPNFSYPTNKLGETPLFIAADKGVDGTELVNEILTNCTELAYKGPHGRTALHAAAMNRSNDAVVRNLLEKDNSLAKEVDQYGWTPLHCAAYYDYYEMVKILLDYDVSAAYIADTKRKMTPLHLAAGQNNIRIMKEIISRCPTCYELIDIRGWNFFHYVIFTLSGDQFKEISGCLPLRKLIRQKDADGNTPLHLFFSFYPQRLYTNTNTTQPLVSRREGVDPYQLWAVTERGSIFAKIQKSGCFHQRQKEILELSKTVDEPYRFGIVTLVHEEEDLIGIETARESHLVVAALIATVTFAAAFTLPGGFIQDGSGQGTAILKRKSAFQAFAISNAVAMVLSVSAVFAYFLMSLKEFQKDDFLFWYSFYSTLYAMGAMVIAFITGAYAMLAPSWLAILIILIGLTYFAIALYLFVRTLVHFVRKSLA